MIIGNGSLAKLINDREGFTFFASGVGDSRSAVLYAEFLREHDTLLEFAGDDECLVYFSTISKFHKMSPYIRHKLKMETLVRLWECTNPHTFINAYKAKSYEHKDEYRYMISKEQLNFITDNLPQTGKHEISIFGEMLKISECLKKAK
jgi:hypothetical protein